jgi:thymidine kinase
MYSGKTSKLLEIYKQCSFCDIPVAVINHYSDKRYHDSMLSTHDKIMIPCIQTQCLGDIWKNRDVEDMFNETSMYHLKIRRAEVILINEGLFFEDLYEVVVEMLKQNKKIYICGLDGDFERKKFGTILDLIPLCDQVRKLSSLCSLCKDGTPGIFSARSRRTRSSSRRSSTRSSRAA